MTEYSTLSLQQQEIIDHFNKGKNLFITGGAGTGKSYLLNYLKRNYTQSGLAVTASTGIAAVNIGGSTIHSWSGIGLGNLPTDQIVSNLNSYKFSKLRKKIRATNILAIDEVSMIPANIFDLLDQVLREIRENNQPFGGLQLVLFGDFLQLPPVNNYYNKTEFCFKSPLWQELNMVTITLEKIFRQNDQQFIKILNNLRIGRLDEEDIKLLSSRINAKDSSALKPTILTTHNHKVEQINQLELNKIPKEEITHSASYFGRPDKIEFLKKNCLATEHLKLKIGAQVMMIKNTYQKDEIINGSLGIIRDFSPKKLYPIVEFANKKILTITPAEWNIEKFDEEKKELVIEASLIQIPLILAWAITIHKSQGLTLDKINCDLREAFSPGQIYVALSRTRSLNSIFLTALNFNKVMANKEALNFYNH